MFQASGKRSVAILLLLLCGLCGPVFAQDVAPGIIMAGGSSGLKGTAFDAAGTGLEGLTVTVGALENANARRTVMTNEKGEFLLEGLPYGYYQLSFEYGGQAYPSNRVLLLAPGKILKADFRLGAIEPLDQSLGLKLGDTDELLGRVTGGVARLVERTGPSGLAWFRTGKGVATLVGGGALMVAVLIATSDSGTLAQPVSPSSP